MKTLLFSVSIALAGVSSTQAQIFRPAVGNGAVLGAVAGGLIGGHNGDRWAQGAIIGGVAGAVLGAALAPQPVVYQSAPPVVYQTPADYGQRVYAPAATTVAVADAPMVGNAPVVVDQGVTQVVRAPAQVVYVPSAPQVVYVQEPQRVYYAPPVVSLGFGYYSGPRYLGAYGPGYYHGGYYRGGYHHR